MQIDKIVSIMIKEDIPALTHFFRKMSAVNNALFLSICFSWVYDNNPPEADKFGKVNL
jgi:hypothetical protein